MAKNLSTILRNPSSPSALTVAYGGTGSSTLTLNSVILGNGASAVQAVAPGTTGNVLTSNGTTWVSGSAPISLPTQTSNSGKYLTTDGASASWAAVTALPTQTGNSGLYLTTNGTSASWAAVASGGGLTSTDDTTTNASYYPIVVTAAGGNVAKTSSSKYYFNPSLGTLYATGFSSLSDETQKTNIVTIDNALYTVKQIESVKFEFKDGGKKSAGVIAQQLEQILPDLVNTADNGLKSVDYSGLIGYLIGAVKELSDKVEQLEAK
jgi:hypothetical protein